MSVRYDMCDPEQEFECPFDASHMIRLKKMQLHIMKCKKNFPNTMMAHCPFNHTHVYPKTKMQYHKANCPDRFMVAQDMLAKNDDLGNTQHGCLTNPVSTWEPPECEENWDDDSEPVPNTIALVHSTGGFGSIANRIEKDIAKKAVVRQSYGTEEVRQPRQQPMCLQQKQKSLQPVHKDNVVQKSISMAGIGRGRVDAAQSSKNMDEKKKDNLAILLNLSKGRGFGRSRPVEIHCDEPTVGRVDNKPVLSLRSTPAWEGSTGYASNYSSESSFGSRGGFGRGHSETHLGKTIFQQDPVHWPTIGTRGASGGALGGARPKTANTQALAQLPRADPIQMFLSSGEKEGEIAWAEPQFVIPVVGMEVNRTKEIRRIQKKLREIDALEQKQRNGDNLDEDQAMKIKKKDDLVQQMVSLENIVLD